MSGHRHTTHEHEHEFEAERGLPEPLPAGERLLWQGAPDWRLLARHAFHVRKLVVYFAAILAMRFVSAYEPAGGVVGALRETLWLVPLAAAAIGIALLLAWLCARTTVYTLTDQRVVMRIGIVLTLTFNLPFRHVDAAALHAMDGDAGDIALTLDASTRIAYLHLWPHARPWKVARTQPMLRALPDAAHVAALLREAWAARRGVTLAASAVEEGRPTSDAGARRPPIDSVLPPSANVPARWQADLGSSAP